MTESLPTVLVPGLFCTPSLYAGQLGPLWQHGPVSIADHRHDSSLGAMVRRLLASAPPQFGLVGLSMGGYVAFEVMRQAPERVLKLALLCTSARPDSPEQIERRQDQIALAQAGRFAEVVEAALPLLLAPGRERDPQLRDTVRRMAGETGPDAFVRQQTAIMGRPDSRVLLPSIRCPTLVLAGQDDRLIPLPVAQEMAEGIPGSVFVQRPGCGHLATLECPHQVNAALAEVWGAAAR